MCKARWREIRPSCHWSIIMQRYPSSQPGTSDLPSEQGDPASQSGTIGLDTFYRRAYLTKYCLLLLLRSVAGNTLLIAGRGTGAASKEPWDTIVAVTFAFALRGVVGLASSFQPVGSGPCTSRLASLLGREISFFLIPVSRPQKRPAYPVIEPLAPRNYTSSARVRILCASRSYGDRIHICSFCCRFIRYYLAAWCGTPSSLQQALP